jgi:competence protein ComEC
MFQGRRLCKISLLVVFIIALSAYSPKDFLGLYDKALAVERNLYDGMALSTTGTVSRKEIKNGKCIYQIRDTDNLISFIIKSDSDNIPTYSKVSVSGYVRLFSVARNEGAFSEKDYYNSMDLYYEISNPKFNSIKTNWFTKGDFFFKLNKSMARVFEDNLPGEESGFLSSIVIGNKGNLLGDLKDLFTLVGVAHILAVSGLHVSVICMAFYKFLRKRSLSFLASGILAGTVAICYGLLTGGSISSIRAIGMFLISLLADILGEAYDALTALSFMAILLLLDNPLYVTNGSFIFTFSAILVINFVALPISSRYIVFTNQRQKSLKSDEGFGKEIKKPLLRRIEEYVVSSLIFSLCIYVGMLPIVTNMYYQTPVLSIFLNLFILPLMPVLLGLGLLAGIIGLFYMPLAVALLSICHVFIYLFELIANLFSKVPFSNVIVGHRSITCMAVYYLVLLILIHIVHFKKLLWVIVAISMTCATWFIPAFHSFEIDILDVGQGDGIFIDSGDGVTFFIDGGSTSSDAVGKYTLLPFLKYKGASSIDYWFVSHTDLDHVSGLIELLESGYAIHSIVFSADIPDGETLAQILSLAKENNTNVLYMKQGDSCGTKHLKLKCVYPFAGATSDDINALSLSLLLEFDKNKDGTPEFTGFFGGDLGANQERLIASSGLIGHVNLLKVSHHGSRFSSDSEFLEALSPDIAVISCAKKNMYGHPSAEAIERLEAETNNIYYTMNSGRIRFSNDGVDLFIKDSR